MSHARTGIPTLYRHCQFRSRLEAKWATFFDIVGWKWEYEPFDLNGWIPDFLLIGAEEQILVEVKPFVSLAEFDTEKIVDAMRNIHAQDKDILLLGCTVFTDGYGSIGWLGEYVAFYSAHDFQKAIFTLRSQDFKNVWGLTHECNSFRDRITGLYDGNRAEEEPHILENIWREAGNNVQWTPTKETQP